MGKKYAVLSMDVEDWYHLDYYSGKALDKSQSMLDGFDNYMNLLAKYDIKTTFFVLSELIEIFREQILYADKCGHEIACHGKSHKRPTQMDIKTFEREITEARNDLSNLVGKDVIGYRAPCYSIDRERYSIIMESGFRYSSSKIAFNEHPLYGKLELDDFEQPIQGIHRKNRFYEFELSTQKFLSRNIPVSGGGYIRLLPWAFMKPLISSHIKQANIYVLYIHPFELSGRSMPKVDGVSVLTNIRARKGLGKVEGKIEKLIEVLKKNGFEFKPFCDIIRVEEQ